MQKYQLMLKYSQKRSKFLERNMIEKTPNWSKFNSVQDSSSMQLSLVS